MGMKGIWIIPIIASILILGVIGLSYDAFADPSENEGNIGCEKAINEGNEVTLEKDLCNASFWVSTTTVHRKETTYTKKVDYRVAAKTFALTEFNTWYVRGLAKRLLDEGAKECEVYRADTAVEPRCECTSWQTQKFDAKIIYDGHRKRYHHENVDRAAISVPSGPNCHHSIKRIKKEV